MTRPADSIAKPAKIIVKPMRPRKGLFLALMALFFLWVAAMLAMYLTTVYPHRHGVKPASQPSEMPIIPANEK